MPARKTLVVLLGPTGIGKTALSLSLAKTFSAPIISADSRQFFREMQIGTAAPTPEQLSAAQHFFVGNKSIFEPYSCGEFEAEVLQTLAREFSKRDVVLLVGGSMLYLDAVCNGIDDIPHIDHELRRQVNEMFLTRGLEYIRAQLQLLDPDYCASADLKNSKRLVHALEVCLASGKPFSSFHTKKKKTRDFQILKIGLWLPREILFSRIEKRVDEMISQGLEAEARELFLFKNLNALNTVGYKEFFDFFEGKFSFSQAVEKIKQNTKIYARKQMTWFSRDEAVVWFSPTEEEKILSYIKRKIEC